MIEHKLSRISGVCMEGREEPESSGHSTVVGSTVKVLIKSSFKLL